jgi:hypothetical protein
VVALALVVLHQEVVAQVEQLLEVIVQLVELEDHGQVIM